MVSAEAIENALLSVFERNPQYVRFSTFALETYLLRELGAKDFEVNDIRVGLHNYLHSKEKKFVCIPGKCGGWEKIKVDPEYQATIDKRNKRIEKNRSKVL